MVKFMTLSALSIDLVKKVKKDLVLIDNYVDTDTLNLLRKKNKDVNVLIITEGKGSLNNKDVEKFNEQYPKLTTKTMKNFHDRFLIIDRIELYHVGASLKDAGKKVFGIIKIEEKDIIKNLIDKIEVQL